MSAVMNPRMPIDTMRPADPEVNAALLATAVEMLQEIDAGNLPSDTTPDRVARLEIMVAQIAINVERLAEKVNP